MAIIYSYPRRIPLASDIMLAAEISAPGEDPPVVKSFTVGQLIELIEGGGGIYAPLNSPQFTGTPYLPIGTTGVTRAIYNNSTSLATTAFVQNVIAALAPANPNLLQVTTQGHITSTPIEANSFVKTGGTGTNVLLDNGDIVALSSIGGNTNLSTSQTATNFTINSDTGDDAVVPLGNGIDAGATLNNYTTAEQTKLAGIAPGAQVNVNADWNATSGDAQILNKPTIPSITNLVPYTGATTDVDLGLNDITAAKLIKDGGQPTQFLMADGNVTIGNGGVYSYEIHVSQIDGNDTTGTGAVLNPVASITKALTLITGLRRTIVIHPGNYTENPSITSQYTVLTTYAQLGGNTALSGTITTNTGCTISGLKMTALTVNGVTGRGNINILNCDISGTFTKNGTADYTLVRFCDIGALNIVSTAGVLAIFGGNASFITINSIGASVLVKNATCVSPVVLVGNATFADCILISTGSTTNALTSSAGTQIVIANSQCVIPTFQGVARVSLNGFYSILNVVFDKPNSTLVASSGTGGSTNSIVYSQFINADKFIKQGGTSAQLLAANGDSITAGTGITISGGTISSTGTSTGITGLGISGSAQTGATQTLAVGLSGTDFGITSSGNTQTFNLPSAGPTARGVVTTGAQTFVGAKTFYDLATFGTIKSTTFGTSELVATSSDGSLRSLNTDDGYPSLDEIIYLSSVTSPIQTQLNHDAGPTQRGAITTGAQTIAGAKTFSTAPILSSLVANQILALDASGNIQSLNTVTYPTLTELMLLRGVTGSTVQVQLNNATESVLTRGNTALGSSIKGVNLSFPFINNISSGATMSTGRCEWHAYFLPTAKTITGVKWWQSIAGVYTAANYCGVGLYSATPIGNMTLVASSTNDGNIWKQASNTLGTKAFDATGVYNAAAGLYYIAILWGASATTTTPQTGVSTTPSTGTGAFDFSNSAKLLGATFSNSVLPTPTQNMASTTLLQINRAIFLY